MSNTPPPPPPRRYCILLCRYKINNNILSQTRTKLVEIVDRWSRRVNARLVVTHYNMELRTSSESKQPYRMPMILSTFRFTAAVLLGYSNIIEQCTTRRWRNLQDLLEGRFLEKSIEIYRSRLF